MIFFLCSLGRTSGTATVISCYFLGRNSGTVTVIERSSHEIISQNVVEKFRRGTGNVCCIPLKGDPRFYLQQRFFFFKFSDLLATSIIIPPFFRGREED